MNDPIWKKSRCNPVIAGRLTRSRSGELGSQAATLLQLKGRGLTSNVCSTTPAGLVALLALALQPAAAMEQAVRLESPPDHAPATRQPVTPPAPSEVSAPSRWELVDEEPPSRWAAPAQPDAVPAADRSTLPTERATLSWELVEPAVAAQTEPLERQIVAAPTWEPTLPGEEISSEHLAREPGQQEQQGEASNREEFTAEPSKRWIIGVGGGARIGIGEATYPMAYGRIGLLLNESIALSIRPGYVFGNSDRAGKPNSEGAFQMPLTLDLIPGNMLSPFAGVGFSTNTDSNGKTRPMATLGIDLNITRNLSLMASINVIYQPEDEDNRDVEALTLLYFRF
jgi:hypothetical protein